MITRTIACFLVFASSAVGQTCIDFDSLGVGDDVTNQFPPAVFSSSPGFVVRVIPGDIGTSGPNYVCSAAELGGADCLIPIFVSFAPAVNALSFRFGDDQSSATSLRILVTGSVPGVFTGALPPNG